MKKSFLTIIVLLFYSGIINSQIINKEPLSPRITGYKIDTKLNVSAKTVSGTMEAFWVNKTNEIVPDIQMHLYMNAFRSSKTTYYEEAGGSPGNKDLDLGWIDLKSFTDKNGHDLIPLMQYISPDDGNPHDKTVLKVMLPEPSAPGDTVFVKINFETKLPDFNSNLSEAMKRAGFKDDFFFVGQWFPKFGVYEPAGMRYRKTGGWNCHQFHAESEFYSDHSVYDVKINVPKEYIVGTGGMLMGETDPDALSKTLVWRAEDIPDFAWTAWPGFAVFTDQWKHVKITLLVPKTRTDQVARQFAAVKNALEYLDKNVGPYPWPHLTFADPPAKTGHASGMEYTTLFTTESSYKIPESFHFPEWTTVHEFGHAYFMGILASNEFEEPWMDEGINTFWEERIVDHYWGENSGLIDFPMFKIPDKSLSRLGYVHSGSRQAVSNNEYSWNYPHGTYGMMSYEKTATWLYTLMGIIGEDATNEVFRQYYREWSFKHPCGKDFVNVVNEVVTKIYGNKFGPDMNWFFDQTLYGTGISDYKVAGFVNRKSESMEGKIEEGDMLDSNRLRSDSLYTATVQLERVGEIMIPVDVLVHFSNGSEVLETWDGKSRYKDFEYHGSRKIDWVKIDPDFKNRMDINIINNSYTNEPDRVPLRRFSNKLISFMQFFISIITL